MAIDTLLETTRLESAQLRLTEAQTAYDATLRGLLASDGKTPIAGPAEHNAATAKALAAYQERMDGITATADGILESIERERLDPYTDPTSRLTGVGDLERANAKRPFVAEDCDTMSIDVLTNRLAWVRAHGDAASKFLYARYAVQRYNRELDAGTTADLSGLRKELERHGAMGPGVGLSAELQRLRDQADTLRRKAQYAKTTVTAPGGAQRGTGKPIAF